MTDVGARLRREPPTFREVAVRRVSSVSPRLVRMTLAGPALAGFGVPEPAASVRLLLPSPGASVIERPVWNGNEFLLADGRRPVIRTLTPRRFDPAELELDVDVVVHSGEGAASRWATSAANGEVVAVSGPGRGYAVDPEADGFLLVGDETALPAMSQLLEVLPSGAARVQVLVEVAHPDARHELPAHPASTVEWLDLPSGASAGDTLVAAVADTAIDAATRVWVAGEAAAVQRIRRHLFVDRGVPRAHATVRGYWKHGRAGAGDAD